MPMSISPSGSSNVGTPAVGTVQGPRHDAHRAGALVGEPGGRRDLRERAPSSARAPAALRTTTSPATPRRRSRSVGGADETSSVTSTVSRRHPAIGEQLRGHVEVHDVAVVVAVEEEHAVGRREPLGDLDRGLRRGRREHVADGRRIGQARPRYPKKAGSWPEPPPITIRARRSAAGPV